MGGSHNAEFGFKIPNSWPSSFESEFGHVRYKATVVFDTIMEEKIEFSETFEIIRTLNLNDYSACAVMFSDIQFDSIEIDFNFFFLLFSFVILGFRF